MTSACEAPASSARGRPARTVESAAARAARRGRSSGERERAGKETRCTAEANAVGKAKSRVDIA